jgi:hypothetical protein
MWGATVVGFGSYSSRYPSGRDGTAARVGFSPRKDSLVLYVLGGMRTGSQSCCSDLVRTSRGRDVSTSNVSRTSIMECSTHWSTDRRVHRGADRRASAND